MSIPWIHNNKKKKVSTNNNEWREKKKKEKCIHIQVICLQTHRQTNRSVHLFWMRFYMKIYWTRFGVEDFRVGESTDVVDEVVVLVLLTAGKANGPIKFE